MKSFPGRMKGESSMATYIVDTSAIAATILPDEKCTTEILKAFSTFSAGQATFIAPDLFNLEMANVLKKGVVRKRFSQEKAIEYYSQFKKLCIPVEPVIDEEVLELSFETDLTTYDAAYLWLALKKGAELLTLDKKLVPYSKLGQRVQLVQDIKSRWKLLKNSEKAIDYEELVNRGRKY